MNKKERPWLLVLPCVILVCVLFLGGLALSIMQSFDYFPLIGKTKFSLNVYKSILTDKVFMTSLAYTLYYSLITTVISMVGAVTISMGLRKAFRGKKAVLFFYQMNLPIPHIVGATAAIMLFSQTGLTSRLMVSMGIINEAKQFPIMINDAGAIGVIITLAWKFIPFMGVAVLGLLQTVGPEYEVQAASLGASPWKTFTNVTLPVMFPSIRSNSIMCFAYAFGCYEVPFLLTGTYPVPTPVLIYQKYNSLDLNARPQAMAMAMILTAVLLVIILLYQGLTSRKHKK